MSQNNTELKLEIIDETRALIAASENRIVTAIGEILDGAILPQIAELQRDMTIVKRHLQLV